MNVTRTLSIWLAGCLVASAVTDEGALNPQSHDVRELIERLGHESFQQRERASAALWKLGATVLPQLEALADSDNPEQSHRAQELIRRIQLSITPDSDPELIAMLESYDGSSRAERTDTLNKLRTMRAWKPMLRLYATEKDPQILERFASSAYQVAIYAAREKLIAGKPEEARGFLEIAPVTAASLISLAEFHRSQGTLARELDRAAGREGSKAAFWRLAIRRVMGQPRQARFEAELSRQPQIAAAMAAIDGDPQPWLQQRLDPQPGAHLSEIERAYAGAALDRWNGALTTDHPGFKTLRSLLADRSSRQRGDVRNALMLLGYQDLAESSLAEEHTVEAFWHHLADEDTDRALHSIGLDPHDYQRPEWVAEIIAAAGEEALDSKKSLTHLCALASFMEARGLHQPLFDLIGKPLLDVATTDQNRFLEILAELGGNSVSTSNSPRLMRDIGAQWAADDKQRWATVIHAIFGDHDSVYAWKGWMAELAPQSTETERVDGLLAMFGQTTDPGGLRDQWLSRAWAVVDATKDENKRLPLLKRLSDYAVLTGMVEHSIRAWRLMPENSLEGIYWGQRVVHLATAGQWQEVADIMVARIETLAESGNVSSSQLHAYAASALRNAGDEKAAAWHDQMADQLSLGHVRTLFQVANGYAHGGDYDRAEVWFRRALYLSDPESSHFLLAAQQYCRTARMQPSSMARVAALEEVAASIMTSSSYRWDTPLLFMRQRLQADTARALSLLEHDRSRAISMLGRSHAAFRTDGALADFFFPMLRQAGLHREHDQWFTDTWLAMQKVIREYPDAHNSLNTAAWFGARAQRMLDDAEKLARRALAIHPKQAAYLDTMAEVQFAKGQRDEAIQWSAKAMLVDPEDAELRRQHAHFKNDPLPPRQ